jgi:hypothetical protein
MPESATAAALITPPSAIASIVTMGSTVVVRDSAGIPSCVPLRLLRATRVLASSANTRSLSGPIFWMPRRMPTRLNGLFVFV